MKNKSKISINRTIINKICIESFLYVDFMCLPSYIMGVVLVDVVILSAMSGPPAVPRRGIIIAHQREVGRGSRQTGALASAKLI